MLITFWHFLGQLTMSTWIDLFMLFIALTALAGVLHLGKWLVGSFIILAGITFIIPTAIFLQMPQMPWQIWPILGSVIIISGICAFFSDSFIT